MKHRLGKLSLVLAVTLSLVFPHTAFAYDLVNTTATFTLPQGATGSNVVLKFGATIAETLTWNVSNSAFEFSDDLTVAGVIKAGSSAVAITDSTGNVDGEIIAADTIDDDSIDFSVGDGVSGVDIPLADTGENFTTDDVESALAQLAGAVGGTVALDDAYNNGSSIDVDGSAVTLTVSDTDNNAALALVQNDVTNNNNALEITNAGSGKAINLAGAGSRSINSTEGDISLTTTTSGDVNITSAAKITSTFADNTASAFLVKEGANAYITIDTTNSSELITFGQGLLVTTGESLAFRDSALTIGSSGDGQMDIDADTELEITAPTVDIDASTAVTISNDLKLDSDGAILGFGADNDVTLTHVADTGLLLNAAMALQFRDSALSISSSSDGKLDVDADTEVEITSPTIDLTASTAVTTSAKLDVGGVIEAGASNIALTDATGNLLWAAMATRAKTLQLTPEIAGAVYSADGGDNVGTLVTDYDATNRHTFYKWTTTESTLQDYNIVIRTMLPLDFSAWNTNPIQVTYLTTDGTAGNNQLDVTAVDTAGDAATLGSNTDLASATWATANIGITDGTWTAGGYIDITVRPQVKDTNVAQLGEIKLNYLGK